MPVMTKKTWVENTHADGLKGTFTTRDNTFSTSRIVAVDRALDAYDRTLQEYLKQNWPASEAGRRSSELNLRYAAVVDAFITYVSAKKDESGQRVKGVNLASMAGGQTTHDSFKLNISQTEIDARKANEVFQGKKRNHRMSVEYRDEDCAGGRKNFDLEKYVEAMEQGLEVLPQHPTRPVQEPWRKQLYGYFKSIRKDGEGDHVFQRLAKELVVEGDLLTNGFYNFEAQRTRQDNARTARMRLLQESFGAGALFMPKAKWKQLKRKGALSVSLNGSVAGIAANLVSQTSGDERMLQLKQGMAEAAKQGNPGDRGDHGRMPMKGMGDVMWEVVTGIVEFAKSLCEVVGDEGFKEICCAIISETAAGILHEAAPLVGGLVNGVKLGRSIKEAVQQAKNESRAKSSEIYVATELTGAWGAVEKMFRKAKHDALWEAASAGAGLLSSVAEWAFPGISNLVAKAVNLVMKIGLAIKSIYEAFHNFHGMKAANSLIANSIQGRKACVDAYDELFKTFPLAGAYVVAQARPMHLIACYANMHDSRLIDVGPYLKSLWAPMAQVKVGAAELILSSSFVLVPGIEKLSEEDKTVQQALMKLCGTAGDWGDRLTALLAA